MRTVVLTLATLACCAGAASAQNAWANKLFDNKLNHDFGTVARGAQLKHSFKMTNIYKVPLQITDIRVMCSCVTVTPSTKLLQPNETAQLNINMDASRFSGPKSVTVYVTVGPEFVSTAALTVTANARQDVVFNPGEIDFGTLAKGQSVTRSIDVEHAGDPAWRVTEIVKNGAAPFDLKVEQLPQKVGGFVTVGYRITASLKPEAVNGNFKHEIILKTNDAQAPVISFHVLGSVRSTLQVVPNPVNLGSLKVGGAEATKFVVSGGRPFRILAIDGLGDGLSIALPDAAKSNHVLEVRAQPTALGAIRRQLTLRTDLDGEAVTVTVEGNVAP